MIFVMFRVLPGDPVQMMMGGGGELLSWRG